MVTYSGSPTVADKPDIAAPGVNIDAAAGRDASIVYTIPTRRMSGTSMAAPHVTGAIALMFEKKNVMTMDEIITALKNVQSNLDANGNPTWVPDQFQMGAGHLDIKKAVDSL